MTKVKLFTHTDLDGISCALVAFAAFYEDNVNATYCSYKNVDERVAKFLDNNEEELYDAVYITDISINEENAERLNELHLAKKIEVKLLDHHDVEWLNKYEWAHVAQKHDDGRPTSGTTMLHEYLKKYKEGNTFNGLAYEDRVALREYTEIVRKYDTWEWAKLNDRTPKDYDTLFWFYGRERWISIMMTRLFLEGSMKLIDGDLIILSILNEKVEKYINQLNDSIIEINSGRYRVGLVFAEDYVSEAGNALHERNPHFDLIALVNMKSMRVSYRTTHDQVDVAKFARYFGGNGRQKTAGSQLTEEHIRLIADSIFAL